MSPTAPPIDDTEEETVEERLQRLRRGRWCGHVFGRMTHNELLLVIDYLHGQTTRQAARISNLSKKLEAARRYLPARHRKALGLDREDDA